MQEHANGLRIEIIGVIGQTNSAISGFLCCCPLLEANDFLLLVEVVLMEVSTGGHGLADRKPLAAGNATLRR